MTPEGKVKAAVKKLLATFDVADANGYGRLYQHWPVQNGMGSPSLDCIVCYYGCYIAIETKAPGKSPTPRQSLTMKQMTEAGGLVFVVTGDQELEILKAALEMIRFSHANNSK